MLSAVTFLALFAPAALALPRRANPLTVSLQAPSQVENVDSLKVIATVTNTGSSELTLINAPDSVLSSWKTNSFALTTGNGTAAFAGYKVKYDPLQVPRTTLAAGQSISVEHELAGAYSFANSGAGSYSVDVAASGLTVVDGDALTSIPADFSGATFDLSGTLHAPEALAVAKTGAQPVQAFQTGLQKRVTYQSCSASQKTGVDAGVAQAQKYAPEAYSALQADTSGSSRYVTWFGAYTSSRHSTVTSHFQKISSQPWSSFTFDCGCTDAGTYAYVNPDTFGVIHLCPVYWTAPTKGTDSKGGTLIHESSHFTANGGTDDHVYGQSGAKQLASSNPSQAIDNADNHEYYAEAGNA